MLRFQDPQNPFDAFVSLFLNFFEPDGWFSSADFFETKTGQVLKGLVISGSSNDLLRGFYRGGLSSLWSSYHLFYDIRNAMY